MIRTRRDDVVTVERANGSRGSLPRADLVTVEMAGLIAAETAHAEPPAMPDREDTQIVQPCGLQEADSAFACFPCPVAPR